MMSGRTDRPFLADMQTIADVYERELDRTVKTIWR
jgi:hypothetical protein